MPKSLFGLTLLLFQLTALAQVDFKLQSIEETLPLAKTEQKLMFVVFSDKNCGYCKWMEQNVYNDQTLSTTINNNLIPVKSNGYTIEGKKEKYLNKVNMLPTMIFFDENGNEVSRVEGKKTLKDMKDIVSGVLSTNCTGLDEKLNLTAGTSKGSACCQGLVKAIKDDEQLCVKQACVETAQIATIPKGETTRTALPCCDDTAVRRVILNSKATKIHCIDASIAKEINQNPRDNSKSDIPSSKEKKKSGVKAAAE